MKKEIEWSTPEVGKVYKDVMPDSATKNRLFECKAIRAGIYPKFLMQEVKSEKSDYYGAFDWVYVREAVTDA